MPNPMAANVVWTLVTGFLVVLMQAGFAMVETGLTRSKNVTHTMTMSLMAYALGALGFFAVGFALMWGGSGSSAPASLGSHAVLDAEAAIPVAGHSFGVFG